MTTQTIEQKHTFCPAEEALKILAGKWKVRILYFATLGPVRFNSLLRQIPDSNKQAIAVALKELSGSGFLRQTVVSKKPLHIEYELTEKGREATKIVRQLSSLV